MDTYDAIMLLSYGGPDGPDDVLPFMRNATRGRGIPDERLLQVAAHYKRFGGVSPINACNQRLIADLSAELARRGHDIPVGWGNRNWHPFVAAEVVPPVGGSPEQPVDLSAASAALDPEDAQALRPLIEDLLDGRYDFNAQFERGLEAILRGWA